MTTDKKVARRKLSLLELASELSNVSKACRIMGYSRQQFYEIRRNFQLYGAEGLLDKLPGAKGPPPNRVDAEVEEAILQHSLEDPNHGCVRVAQELVLKGIQVSSGGVRGVWSRHGLRTKHERLLRLERTVAERKLELSDDQIRLLERFSPEFRERHIETKHTRDLVAVDTFFVGTLKGMGRVYLQTVIDCCSRYAWGRLYTSKLPVTAVHVLNIDELPTFEQHNARIDTILSDNGREFCGRPQSNGFVERLHKTLLDEHFRIQGRTKGYEAVEEMQKDLDAYLHTDNHKRPHQGRNMNGRTPHQVFKTGLPKLRKASARSVKKAA